MPKGMKPPSPSGKPIAKPISKGPSGAPKGKSRSPQNVAASVTRGQLQGAATSKQGPKKLDRSNVLFSGSLVEKAKKWTQKTFGTTRKKVHKALSEDPAFLKTKHATPENVARMKAGKAPTAPKEQWLGKRKTMELDHKWERRDGVKENRVDNLRLVGPLTHKMKMMRKFHQAAGTEMPRDLRASPKKTVKKGIKSV